MATKLVCVIFVCFHINEIFGHGMMLDPPNRSSLWRFDSDAPVNYEDNQNFCGGYSRQWSTFGGKCGVCGDPYDTPHPQPNENTGVYGQGHVVRHYESGSRVQVNILLTTNHLGNFKYSLCELLNSDAPESGEDCFRPLLLADGSSQYNVSSTEKSIANIIKLPELVTCDRCVLRWHYTVGNNWGKCDDGTYREGCGPQETFRSCADIAIV